MATSYNGWPASQDPSAINIDKGFIGGGVNALAGGGTLLTYPALLAAGHAGTPKAVSEFPQGGENP